MIEQLPILELTILFPLISAIFIALFIPTEDDGAVRGATLVTSIVTFVVSVPLLLMFDTGGETFQFVERYEWLAPLGASLHIGLDGISLLLIVLTTFLVPACVICSWRGVTHKVKNFHVALLVLEFAMVGVFAARDMLLFFLFWEVMLIPMFLLIGVWGAEERVRAAIKFFIYTAVGSLLMLAAIFYIYVTAGRTFDMVQIGTELAALRDSGALTPSAQWWLCLAFLIAFAIKVPVFPFHTWLPHAHVQAPTAGSVVLAAVLLKMGGYGFIRFCLPLFPQGLVHEYVLLDFTSLTIALPSLAAVMAWLGVIGVIYGALMALAQKDLKRLIAYSSISHLGLVVIGVFAAFTGDEGARWLAGTLDAERAAAITAGHGRALTGAVFQMLAHGLSTGALFFLVGVIYDRRHTKEIARLSGLAKPAPWLAACFVIATLASIAVPGTCGFVGELLILLGVFQSRPILAVFGITGMVLGACYMLWAVQRCFFGPTTPENEDVEDIDRLEFWAGVFPILSLAIVLGIFPGPLLTRLEPAIQALLTVGG